MAARYFSEAHAQTYKRVAKLMLTCFGDQVAASVQRTELSMAMGSARVDVRVAPWRADALVTVSAVVVVRPRVDFDLMEFLLHHNEAMDMGAFALSRNQDVVFKQALLAEAVSEGTLKATVWSVLRIADQFDDLIQNRWGGQRASDRIPTATDLQDDPLAVTAGGADTLRYVGDGFDSKN